jgi:hypothetical protein
VITAAGIADRIRRLEVLTLALLREGQLLRVAEDLLEIRLHPFMRETLTNRATPDLFFSSGEREKAGSIPGPAPYCCSPPTAQTPTGAFRTARRAVATASSSSSVMSRDRASHPVIARISEML